MAICHCRITVSVKDHHGITVSVMWHMPPEHCERIQVFKAL